jgi:hypothetical protein
MPVHILFDGYRNLLQNLIALVGRGRWFYKLDAVINGIGRLIVLFVNKRQITYCAFGLHDQPADFLRISIKKED